MKPKYLDRRLTLCSTRYCLCLSEKEFNREMERLKVPIHKRGEAVRTSDAARTHFVLETESHLRVALVCLNGEQIKGYTGIQIASLLVHEAVHIWQDHASQIVHSMTMETKKRLMPSRQSVKNYFSSMQEEWCKR